MIDFFLEYAADPAARHELEAAMGDLIATAGRGETALVGAAERAVRAAKPGEAFSFDAGGFATLEEAGGHCCRATSSSRQREEPRRPRAA